MSSLAANRASNFSTYSGAPSLHPSLAPSSTIQQTNNRMVNTRANNYETEKPQIARNPSKSTVNSTDSRFSEIKTMSATIERMQDQRLEKQRYEMSGSKDDEISTNALGAKLERALGRRMVGQDAVFTRRAGGLPEKRNLEVGAA